MALACTLPCTTKVLDHHDDFQHLELASLGKAGLVLSALLMVVSMSIVAPPSSAPPVRHHATGLGILDFQKSSGRFMALQCSELHARDLENCMQSPSAAGRGGGIGGINPSDSARGWSSASGS